MVTGTMSGKLEQQQGILHWEQHSTEPAQEWGKAHLGQLHHFHSQQNNVQFCYNEEEQQRTTMNNRNNNNQTTKEIWNVQSINVGVTTRNKRNQENEQNATTTE